RGGYFIKPALNQGGDTDRTSSSYAPAQSVPENAPLYHTLDPTEEAISAQLVSPAYETPTLSTSQYNSASLQSTHPSLPHSILRDNAPAKILQTGSSYSPRSLSNYGQQGGWTRDGTGNQQDWDLDFLEGVMKDVLAQREHKSRLGEVDSPLLVPASINRENNPTHHASQRAELGTQGGHRSILGHLDDGDSSGSDISVTSVSQLSEEGRRHLGGREGALQRMEARRRRVALFLVFSRLNTPTLLKCAAVCREWRSVSRDPALWQYVHLYNRRISSKFLKTLAQWCSQLKWLVLERLSPRERRKGERVDTYQKKIRGTLEPGLEELLQASGDELLTMKIVDCPNIVTERVLWLCSCHCRNLRSVTYISSSDPVGPEVVWALGAGCRRIVSLKIPPRHPCEKAKKFGSSCVSMIGRCWSNLQALSVGGQFVKPESLAIVVKSCPKLQVLELDHMVKVTEDKAVVLCRSGLRGLHTLILKHTPITPSAIIHFNGACPQLTKISVYLSLSDFFQPPASPGQRKEYSRAIETLLDLSKNRILTDTLQVRADYK
ncbi:F-box only protein 41-like, partial [Diadema antillarum]|uniref:F-box only protein 41-like n=1 Tax=Diadema antillarum TaxID=105358 RepID=UPI003A86D5F1